MPASSAGPSPMIAARGMPCTLPLGEVSGVLMSAWASIQIRPTFCSCTRRCWRKNSATPATVPAATEWSPPSTSGNFPASSVFNTCSACLVQVAVISFRYLAWGSPDFFCSAMATAILPPSSTMWPSCSRRASSPATRTAEGPMSTPRREAPRSSGTPRILIFLGTMLSATTGGFAGSVLMATGAAVVDSGVIDSCLWIDARQCSRKRNCFTHVLQAAHPGHGALNAHAKPGVRHAAKLAQVQIPLERRFRQIVFLNTLEQQVVVANALRAADNLAVAFRRQHIHAQRQLRALRIRLHIEGFHLGRVAMNHHRLIKL